MPRQKAGKQTFRNDDTANVHVLFGRIAFSEPQIKENLDALLAALRRAKPATSKGIFLKHVTICTSMGPSIALDLSA